MINDANPVYLAPRCGMLISCQFDRNQSYKSRIHGYRGVLTDARKTVLFAIVFSMLLLSCGCMFVGKVSYFAPAEGFGTPQRCPTDPNMYFINSGPSKSVVFDQDGIEMELFVRDENWCPQLAGPLLPILPFSLFTGPPSKRILVELLIRPRFETVKIYSDRISLDLTGLNKTVSPTAVEIRATQAGRDRYQTNKGRQAENSPYIPLDPDPVVLDRSYHGTAFYRGRSGYSLWLTFHPLPIDEIESFDLRLEGIELEEGPIIIPTLRFEKVDSWQWGMMAVND